MPVPKKRLGHSDQGHRRSNWKATLPTINICSNCGSPKHMHTMCGVCGFYKDRIVSDRFDQTVAAQDHDHHDHDHDHDHHDHAHDHAHEESDHDHA